MAIVDQLHDSDDLDRWELLNAYLDGEVTPAQEEQVEQWLQEDPAFGDLYQNLMALSTGCHGLPEPPMAISSHELCDQVFAEVDRRDRNHHWWWWGLAALVGTVSTAGVLMPRSLTPQIAQQENPPAMTQVAISPPPLTPSDRLNISIHQSVIEIPKAPVARPVKLEYLDYQ